MEWLHNIQKKEIEALGDNPIEASMKMHREKLEVTSTVALNLLHDDLPSATVDQRVKIYDTTRRHLNVIDGREGSNTTNNIIIIPGELVQDYTREIQEERRKLSVKKKPTTLKKKKINGK